VTVAPTCCSSTRAGSELPLQFPFVYSHEGNQSFVLISSSICQFASGYLFRFPLPPGAVDFRRVSPPGPFSSLPAFLFEHVPDPLLPDQSQEDAFLLASCNVSPSDRTFSRYFFAVFCFFILTSFRRFCDDSQGRACFRLSLIFPF